MSIIQLIYCSKGINNLTEENIESIWLNSIIKNTMHSIQGILLFHDNQFIQLLEGKKDDVKALYENIIKDERHYDVTLIGTQNIEKEEFKKWAMGYILNNSMSLKVIKKYFPSDFIPEKASFLEIKTLLEEISEIKDGIASIILP